MPTITIGSNAYEVYADVSEADEYFAAAIHAANWTAAETTTKQQALVTATRMFDRTCWQGEKTDEGSQPLSWPRSGLTDSDGNAIPDIIVPDFIINGFFELALSLVDGSTVQTNATPGAQGLQIIKAGSVMLQYFRGAESLQAQQDRFPLPVMEYVGAYLCGANFALTGVATGASSGTDDNDTSVTGDRYGYNEGI